MTTAYFLVDYYNIADLKNGLDATYNDHHAALTRITGTLESYVRREIPSASEMRVRLYGGWLLSSDAGRTSDGGSLHALTAQYFRVRLDRRLRMVVELAEALIDLPQEPLHDTVRPKPGLPWFRIILSSCPHVRSDCPLADLHAWRRGTCPRRPDCAVRTTQAIEVVQQKLVDCMIVSDAHALSRDPGTPVVIVSNDDDVVPGALSASRVNAETRLLRLGRRKPSPYDGILAFLNVHLDDH